VQIHYSEGQLDTELLLTGKKELGFAVTHDSEEVGEETDGGRVVPGEMAQGKIFTLLLLGRVEEVGGELDSHLQQGFRIGVAVPAVEHEIDRWHACVEEKLESVEIDECIGIWNQVETRLWSSKNAVDLRFKIKIYERCYSLSIITILSIIRIFFFVYLT